MELTTILIIATIAATLLIIFNRGAHQLQTPDQSEMSFHVRHRITNQINNPMKIYISGQITGTKPEVFIPKFEAAEQALINAGVAPEDIVNPTKLGIEENTPWDKAMETCIEALNNCTAIYMLLDWKKSLRARHELTHAGFHRKDIYFEESQRDLEMIRECKLTGVL